MNVIYPAKADLSACLDQPSRAFEPSSSLSVRHLPSFRILLAENDGITRVLLSEALEDFGYIVTEASNGLEAMQMAEREAADLLISGLEMVQMTGADLIRQVKQKQPHLPVILLTESHADAVPFDIRLQLSCLMHKPASIEGLLHQVHQHCIRFREGLI